MTNKKIWLGMLVLALVFGMTVVGCETEWEDPVVKITNGTTFQVKSVLFEKEGGYNYDTGGYNWIPVKSDPEGISSGASKSYTFAAPHDEDAETFFVKATLTVTLNAILEATISKQVQLKVGYYDLNSSNPAWSCDLLLSGTDYNSLQFNEVD